MSRFFDSTVPNTDNLEPTDIAFLAKVNKLCKDYICNMEACCLRDGIHTVLNIARLGNIYFQVNQPWILVKKAETRLVEIIISAEIN